MKKTISLVLSFIILISSVCALDLTAFAASANTISYTYDKKTSTLVIKCNGKIENGSYSSEHDWEAPDEFVNAKKVIFSEGITGIGYDCFSYLEKVEEISFPSTLEYILGSGEYFGGFRGLNNLKTVNFKNGLKTIRDAFENCSSLERITLPSSLEELTVHNWNSIKSLTIPSSIKDCYIESCENLQSVTISAGSEFKIGNNSKLISDCPKLKSLYVYSTNISFGNNANLYGSNCKNAVTYCYPGTQVYNNCKKNNYKVKTITEPSNPLPCVTGLKATGSDTKQINLTWNKVSGATGYYVDIMKNGKYVRYATTQSNKISVKGLTSFQEYTFRVKAYKNLSGKTYYGKYWVGVTYGTRAPRISGFKATGSNNSAVYLAWNKNARATGYRIYKYDPKTKKDTLYKDIKGANNTTLKVSGLKNNTKYYFKIQAYYTVNGRTYLSYRTNAITTATKYNMVTLNSAKSNSKKKITVKWNKAIYDGSGYQVMWSTTKNFSSNYLTVNVNGRNSLSTTLNTAQSGKRYYVRVRAYKTVNGKKTYCSWSGVKSVVVK